MDAPRSADRFRYGQYQLDLEAGTLACHYRLADHRFVEHFRLPRPPAGCPVDQRAAHAAARLVHLVAGVSYFKTLAPPVVDLGEQATTPLERGFLLDLYRRGLAEFAYRNGLDLRALELVGPDRPPAGPLTPDRGPIGGRRPLVPFGGGIDSIVVAELVRARAPEVGLFVVHRPGQPFEPIEAAARVSGLPVLRAERQIDPQLLRPAELGYLQGHVPVTAIISALAVLAAICTGREAVVMSNERSASAPNLVADGEPVNHQWSKSLEFETALRAVLAESLGPAPAYFSMLRPYSELWVARHFATMASYHGVFRSCNRSFHQDRAARLESWCAECDKCCFIDLVLAPFLQPEALAAVFGSREPLADPRLADRFRTLIGLAETTKPFECVGDVSECRAAMVAVAGRPDRAGSAMVQELAAALGGARDGVDPEQLRPAGPHHIPEAYAPEPLLV